MAWGIGGCKSKAVSLLAHGRVVQLFGQQGSRPFKTFLPELHAVQATDGVFRGNRAPGEGGAVVAIAIGAQRAGAQEPADSAALVTVGRTIFEGKQGGALCVTCHGPQGKGVAGLGPDLTDAKWLHGDGSAAFLQAVIRSGVAKPPKFNRCASPQAWTFNPVLGVRARSAAISAAAPR